MSVKTQIEKAASGFPSRFKEAFDNVKNAEIARRLGKGDAVVKHYVEGRLPAPDILIHISILTNVSIHWLLTGKGQKFVTNADELLPSFGETELNVIRRLASENKKTFSEQVRELTLTQLINQGLISEQMEKGVTFEFYGGLIEVPLLGEIAAGEPITVFPQNEKVQIAKTFEFEDREVFSLRVRGDSMQKDDIHEGDLIICVRSQTARDGDRVVVLIDGDKATVKRYYRDNDKVRLQPANSTHNPSILDAKRVEIQGIVRGIQRRS